MPHWWGPCWWLLPCTSARQHSLLEERTLCQPLPLHPLLENTAQGTGLLMLSPYPPPPWPQTSGVLDTKPAQAAQAL